MAEIAFEQVRKVYPDGTEAVAEIDLQVDNGQLLVLVGPSGCGKSTLLRMVAGLEEISAGTITIGGRRVNDLPPRERDVAMVFQNYALYPHMSVYDNLGFGLKLRKTDKATIDRRVREAADVLGITEYLERKPRALSGGQRQRVAMGRAIVREPQAFLMDEPLSNLDAKLRVQMRAEISRIQSELGVTTIYVTHDQTEAMTMGDQVAVMRRGILQQVAPPQTLYDHPQNLFVAGFIGSPAMNLVEAAVVSENGSFFVEFGGSRLRVDEALLADRPAVRGLAGREVVIGIRPESMEDASLAEGAPGDRRLNAVVKVREAMGAEVYVHFDVAAPPVITDETIEAAAADEDMTGAELLKHQAGAATTTFVARLLPQTRAAEREPIELVVDTRKLYFFDPETHESI